MRALLAISALATSRALVAPNAARALRPSTRLHVFKEPTTPKPVEAPRRPKSKLRPRDPSLYMEPVPLVPDAEGNWEPLVSEIWTDVEKMSKLAETNFKAELSRFRDFCDHYSTARGTIESNGRTLSAQTRLFDVDFDDQGPIRKTKDHKWVRKLAKRVHPIVLEEYEQALNPTTTRNGTWATRKQITWSNTQVMAVRGTPWDAPPTASEEEVADPKAGMDEAARDAAAAAEEMSAGDGDARYPELRLPPRKWSRSWKSLPSIRRSTSSCCCSRSRR